MNDQEQLNVCPRCGAVLNNGVCPGCGYEAPKQEAQIDSVIYNAPDVYESQVENDIYQSTDTEVVPGDTGGRFSGSRSGYGDDNSAQNMVNIYNENPYTSAPEYGSTQNNGGYNITPYQSGNNGYGYGNPYQNTGNAYGDSGNPYQNTGNIYGVSANPYQNTGNTYGGNANPYQNTGNTYGVSANPYQNTGNTYGGSVNPYQNAGNMYGNGQFSNNANTYGGPQFYGAENNYGKNPYPNNNVYGGNPYAPDYGYSNPYSPYAAPQKKKHTGLIIGIIITVVILFFIALFALFYNAFNNFDEKEKNNNSYDSYYDDYFYNYDDDSYYYDPDYGYDYYYPDYDYDYYYPDYDYDYDYDYNFDDDHDYDSDEYYTLHNDDKKGLDYTIDWEYYSHDTDNENVSITIKYPIIVGDAIPNLDKLNETIADEVEVITKYYEEDYSKYMLDEDNYFLATSEGYITYMREDVLSIAFSEYIYSDYYNAATLYCINIDMKDGVVMSNTGIIDVNDDFSIDFRKRSDKQNGAIEGLTLMTDQEITKHLTSEDNLIIFYTPQGLEVGFNYDDGWVTVTYKDYEDFLKIF